jgi:hypothetical protein
MRSKPNSTCCWAPACMTSCSLASRLIAFAAEFWMFMSAPIAPDIIQRAYSLHIAIVVESVLKRAVKSVNLYARKVSLGRGHE